MYKIYPFLLFFFILMEVSAQQFEENSSLAPADQEEIAMLINCSEDYYYSGNFVKSLEYNVKFLNKALSINNNTYIAKAYGFLGYDYIELGDTILARKNFEKQQKYAFLTNDKEAIANTYMNLANLYGSVYLDWDKAWKNHKKSIALYKETGDSSKITFAYYNTVLSAVRTKHFSEAKVILKTLDRYSEFLNPSNALFANILWGRCYMNEGNYVLANTYFLKTITNADKDENLVELAEAYKGYSESLTAQERYKEAYRVRLVYEEIIGKNYETIQESDSEHITAQYQLDEYKREAANAELRRKLQETIAESKSKNNKLLTLGITCVVTLLIILFFLLKQKTHLVSSLKQKNKEYLEAKRISEEMVKSKSKFFSTVSHELRTPLYGVIGLTGILLDDKSLKSHQKDLKSLKFSADYLLALINDVLQLNKIDAETLEDEKVNFDLNDLLKTILDSFSYVSQQNNNTITVTVDPSVPEIIKGNSIRLSQILMNLVGNASKFTKNGTITISVKNLKKSPKEILLLFSVNDTGVGIPKEKQESIFNEFSQVNSVYYNAQGTGLGLAIVKKLLLLADSDIKLESELGKGSEFSFELLFGIDEKSINTNENLAIDEDILEGKEILIVDDNKINQMITARILKKYKVNTTIVEDGMSAISKVKEKHFDLVLMDVNMPDIDGFKTTKRIRKFNDKVAIVALTAVEIEEIRNKIHNSGMNDFITKPYDVTKFVKAIIKNIMNASSKNPPSKTQQDAS